MTQQTMNNVLQHFKIQACEKQAFFDSFIFCYTQLQDGQKQNKVIRDLQEDYRFDYPQSRDIVLLVQWMIDFDLQIPDATNDDAIRRAYAYNFQLLQAQLEQQNMVLAYIRDNLVGLDHQETQTLTHIIKWQQGILSEVKPLDAALVNSAYDNYASATADKRDLLDTYYFAVATTTVIIGMSIMVGGLLTMALALAIPAASGALTIAGMIMAHAGVPVLMFGGLTLNATIAKPMMRLFSKKRITQIDNDIAQTKDAFNETHKSFETMRQNTLSNSARPCQTEATHLSEFSDIFVTPVQSNTRQVSEALLTQKQVMDKDAEKIPDIFKYIPKM